MIEGGLQTIAMEAFSVSLISDTELKNVTDTNPKTIAAVEFIR